MIRPEELAGKVIGYTGGVAIKRAFGIDTRTYAWVKDFVRDKESRDRIKRLQEKITEVEEAPIHRDELKEMFEERVKKINGFRIAQLKEHLAEVQQGKAPLMNERLMDSKLVMGARMYPFFMQFSSADMGKLFSEFPEGIRQKDKDETIKQFREEIQKLEDYLARELSPQERWFHRENGNPHPYPQGCRWTAFVETWRRVASRFEGDVDIEGYRLKTDSEHQAYVSLGLNEEPKIPPLREPY